MTRHDTDTGTSHALRLLDVASQDMRAGRLDKAWQICRQVLQAQNDQPVALHLLGLIEHRRGKHSEAVELLERSVRLNCSDPSWFFNLGSAAFSAGQYDLSAEAYRQALRLNPEDQQARYQLGLVYQAAGRHDQASDCYVQVLDRNPNHANAAFKLGCLLLNRGDLFTACDLLQNAVNHAPDRHPIRVALALALRDAGQFEQARCELIRVVEHVPDDIDAVALLSSVSGRMGRTDDAWELIRPLVGSPAANSNVALVFAELAPALNRVTDAIAMLDQQLQEGDPADSGRMLLHFAIASLLDQNEQYDDAFSHYAIANEFAGGGYDPSEHEQFIDAMIATCGESFMSGPVRSDRSDRRPIFIVGMPRSGTSLLVQILATHPQLHGAGELPYISRFSQVLPAQLPGNKPYPQCLADLRSHDVNALATIYLDHLDKLASGYPHVTDKTPTNYLHLGLIRRILPGARIIHCRRHPVATCFSCFTHYFAGSHPFSHNLEHLGHYYREYQRLMNHWRQLSDMPIHEVRYEQLVTEPEPVIRQLLEYCDLPWHDGCLEFHLTDRPVATASWQQVKKPLYRSSIDHWRHYRKHLSPLQLEELES